MTVRSVVATTNQMEVKVVLVRTAGRGLLGGRLGEMTDTSSALASMPVIAS